MDNILGFIATYWLEFVLSGCAAGVVALGKVFYNLIKKELSHNKEEFKSEIQKGQEEFYKKFNEEIKITYEQTLSNDRALEEQISRNQSQSEQEDVKIENEMEMLKRGLLSIQGKQFKEDCRALLKEDHVLTIDEYEQIEEDHSAYNGLGGNHHGDNLFNLVQKKAEETFSK